MTFKLFVLVASLAYVNAGFLGSPAISAPAVVSAYASQPVAVSTPLVTRSVAPVAYAAQTYSAPIALSAPAPLAYSVPAPLTYSAPAPLALSAPVVSHYSSPALVSQYSAPIVARSVGPVAAW